jgi:CHAD domain-containing protein
MTVSTPPRVEPGKTASAPSGIVAGGDREAEAPAAAVADTTPTWHRAPPFDFDPRISTENAWIAALTNGLAHLRANQDCVIARSHEEGVHQMRVALRRLRSRLEIYRPLLPELSATRLDGELKWLTCELGAARDWDVFIGDVLALVRKRLPEDEDLALLAEHAERMRDDGYLRAQAALRSAPYAALLADLVVWIADRPWRVGLRRTAPWTAPATRLASAVLAARHADAMANGEHLATMGAAERHRLRIEIKKQRYAAEFFGSLYAEARVEAYLSALKDLQDSLGTLNDLAVAARLTRKLSKRAGRRERSPLNLAAGMVLGFHLRSSKAEDGVERAWRAFTACRPFWLRRRPAGTPSDAGTEAGGLLR